ncbi:uncharacterized protein PG986_015172 [Apiospora aurea]|uniref:DUF6594 domain-containing protein n=1 Tax=Apiospora aurea TaxID=335848 RepID=A0ABR1PRU4_9PEZI
MQSADVQRPPTPEKRSHRVGSANPTDVRSKSIVTLAGSWLLTGHRQPTPKYKAGNEVWFRPPGDQAYAAFKIANVKKEEDGSFVYQIKGVNDKLYSNGVWVPQKKVKKMDCKEQSYRSVATFLDSDENFMIYRRFGYLHARILLRLQDKLRALEDLLDDLDDEDAAGNETRRSLLWSRDNDEAACKAVTEKVPTALTRTRILDEIEVVLGKYDDWVIKAQQMVSLNKPAERDSKSVEAQLFDRKLLVDEERGFIYQKEDLITLRDGREMAVLDSFTERLIRTFHCPLLQREMEKTNDPDLHYYSKARKDCFNTTILCMVLLALLVLPILVLYKLLNNNPSDRLYTVSIGVVIVFVLVFSAVLSLFTKAKRHEIFAAAAGYAAVLVVFFGNIS